MSHTIVTGVIGSDTHIVGNRILSMALEDAGYRVVSLGALTPAADFIRAAIETAADAILVSSLYGQGELDCRGFRDLCVEAGLEDILLYVGGNLVVGKQPWDEVRAPLPRHGFRSCLPAGYARRGRARGACRGFRRSRMQPAVPRRHDCPARADHRSVVQSRRTHTESAVNAALLIDFGSTWTKLRALDMEPGDLIASAQGPSTVATDIDIGLDAALEALAGRMGALPRFACRLASSSAAGGLRMVTVGLVRELTAEAARQAALGAGARLIGGFAYRLTEANRADRSARTRHRPAVRGHDGGNTDGDPG